MTGLTLTVTCLLLGALALASAAPVAAQSPERLARARLLVIDSMAARKVPGASVTVLRNGQVIWSEGFGLADIEQSVPVTPRTVFRIGSVSKALTSVALGILAERGRLDFDADVRRYVPGFPAKRWPFTVRQVAGHLAGIRHYLGDEFASQRHYATVLDGLAIFQDDSLLFEPGTRYLYSSYGWNLLSAVVEGASGQPFLQFMREAVFRPAGMTATVAEFADSIIPHRADFYAWVPEQNRFLNAAYVDNSYKWAGGGFLSTTEDLARFGQAMLAKQLVSDSMTRTLWTPMSTTQGRVTGYGIGWSINRDSVGLRVGHTGGSMGATASLQIYPESGLVIAMLVNSDRSITNLAPRIGAILLAPEGSGP